MTGSPAPPPGGRCRGTKADGSPCRAYPPRGGTYCSAHDPDGQRHRDLSAKGGAASWGRRLREASDRPSGAAAVLAALVEILEKLMGRGKVDVNRTRTAIYCCQVALTAVDAAETSLELAAITAKLDAIRGGVAGDDALEPWERPT